MELLDLLFTALCWLAALPFIVGIIVGPIAIVAGIVKLIWDNW